MEKGFGVVYGSAPDLLAKIERERFVRGGGSDETLQGLMSCDLLILDDLGAEFSNQFTIAVLYQLLNGRLWTRSLLLSIPILPQKSCMIVIQSRL